MDESVRHPGKGRCNEMGVGRPKPDETPEESEVRKAKKREQMRKWRAENPERAKTTAHVRYLAHPPAKIERTPEVKARAAENARKNREENPEKIREQFRRTYAHRVEREGTKYLERSNRLKKEYRERLKRQVMDAYGGHCVCCGESELAFLNIDHIYNDGTTDRKEKGIDQLYRWLRNNNFPKDRYRILCWNCNMARRVTGGGVCPHETKMTSTLTMGRISLTLGHPLSRLPE